TRRTDGNDALTGMQTEKQARRYRHVEAAESFFHLHSARLLVWGESLNELDGSLKPLLRLLGHQLANQSAEGGRSVGAKLFDRGGWLVAVAEEFVDHFAAGKGGLAAEQKIESAAEAIEIGADIGMGGVAGLFG